MALNNGNEAKKDHWNSQAYAGAASFVPQLTRKVVSLLDAQKTDTILDIGCGDGVLSANIAPHCTRLIGLDSSGSMISTARENVSSQHPNAVFCELDCRRLSVQSHPNAPAEVREALGEAMYDKAFSNAAMHWILGAAEPGAPRVAYFEDVFKLLKPGGVFVFEHGGWGNVNECHAALIGVLHWKYGLPLEEIDKVDPWFFPSDVWMRQTLEKVGFEVDLCELEDRPTRLTEDKGDGKGGLEGWLMLMGAPFLELLDGEDKKREATKEMCRVLRRVVTRAEDDSQWIGYRRLRAKARRPAL